MAGAILTAAGAAKVAAFATGGPLVQLVTFAVGDAGGVPYDPNVNQAGLVGEKWRGGIASVGSLSAGTFVIECVLPANVNDGQGRASHGFNLAEMGIFDATGTLFAVARLGNGYKPVPASGQAEEITIKIQITVGNASAVSVTIDPNSMVHIGRLTRLGFMAVDGLRNDPPAVPALNSTFATGAGPTGAWAGHVNEIAQWLGTQWVFRTVPLGHVIVDNSKDYSDPAYFMRKLAAGWEQAAASDARYGFSRLATTAEAAAGQDQTVPMSARHAALYRQQSRYTYCGAAGGTANAIVLHPTPAMSLADIIDGSELTFLVTAANTAATTISILGTVDLAYIVYNDTGDALSPSALVPGMIARVTRGLLNGNPVWRLHRAQSRFVPQSAVTLYVRTDGNDANDGSANTSAKAFATLQAAFDYFKRRVDLGGTSLTIKLGLAGTYAGMFADNAGMQGKITIEGNTASEATYIVTLASAVAGRPRYCLGAEIPLINARGLTLDYSGGTGATYAIWATAGGRMLIGPNITLTLGANNLAAVPFAADSGGIISFTGAITVTAAALRSILATFLATSGGKILGASSAAPATITFSNIDCSSLATAVASGSGSEIYFSSVSLSGTAFGPRYSATLNGIINTSGGGANFIPGNSVGTTATGGQYA